MLVFLLDDNGDRIEDHDNMCEIVKQYSSSIFVGDMGKVNSAQINSLRLISSEQNAKLTEKVSFEEFTATIKQMHLDKVSGPNG